MAVTLTPADVRGRSNDAYARSKSASWRATSAAPPTSSTTSPARAGRSPSCCIRRCASTRPYTHVPFHQRLDDGLVKFVNNDHCLLSARATRAADAAHAR